MGKIDGQSSVLQDCLCYEQERRQDREIAQERGGALFLTSPLLQDVSAQELARPVLVTCMVRTAPAAAPSSSSCIEAKCAIRQCRNANGWHCIDPNMP